MSQARQILLLAGKDLRIESRSRQTIGLVIVLGILIVVVLALGLGPGPAAKGRGATAILWVAYLFGGVLVFEKTMSVERHDDALAGLLLAPVDRGSIYIAKLLANLALMLALALVVTPVGILLFHFDLSAARLSGFVKIMGLSILGFAAVGTLFSAATSSSRLQGGLLPLLVFPLSLPLVIASTNQMVALYSDEPTAGRGLGILVAFDAMFLVASWLTFELILEP